MDWDRRYLEDDTPWDKGYASPALTEIIDRFNPSGTIWVPGTGLGHDARALAQRLPKAKVIGIDISDTALARAKNLENPKNLSFEKRDILNVSTSDQCDAWFEHTCFCAIDPTKRTHYAAAAARHIQAGGILAGVFFVSDKKPPNEGPPYYALRSEITSHFEKEFTLLEHRPPQSSYSGREGLEEILIFQRKS